MPRPRSFKLRTAARRQPGQRASRLSEFTAFKSNPGDLRALAYVPAGLTRGAPLVVVLHGCTQTAAGYDQGSGWSRLADRHGFALLFPEQQRSNNPNLCFNWFNTGDCRRGLGEAASIRSMVEGICDAHAVDRARVFVTGLSAGGAMANALLAAYPDVFSGGAIIAGLPYGSASNIGEAFEAMSGRAPASAAGPEGAAAYRGPWPRISIWHGSEDRVVVPSNAEAIARQWAHLHGLPPTPSLTEIVDGHPRHVWLGSGGNPVIERYVVTGMGHGTPLRPGTGDGQSGEAMAHMLDVGLSSTDRIAAFFGIAAAQPATVRRSATMEDLPPPKRLKPDLPPPSPDPASAAGIQKVIQDALRTAGLLR